jgi:hypothetical protein
MVGESIPSDRQNALILAEKGFNIFFMRNTPKNKPKGNSYEPTSVDFIQSAVNRGLKEKV